MKNTIKLISAITLTLLINGCASNWLSPIDNNFAGWSFYSEDASAKQKHTWKIDGDVLKCSGIPRGYLYTQEIFRDFTITLKWRWPDGTSEGKGGVLFDITGENKIWPKSMEAQINAEAAGDFWALDGYKATGDSERINTLSHDKYGDLINIFKSEDAEKPAGQWNTYKIVAKGKNITLFINGKQVNKAERSNLCGGRICITAEGTGIEYKDIKITAF